MQRTLLALSILVLCCSHSGCERENPSSCKFGCPEVVVLASFNHINDTMYVGDTMILTLQIPDSIQEDSEAGVPQSVAVEGFENQWSYTGIFRIDTMEENKISKDPSDFSFAILEGGDYRHYTFSSQYPFVHKVRYIFKRAGDYFLNSGYDNACIINGTLRKLIIDYNIAEKHFEWLEPYIVPNGGTVEMLRYNDSIDKNNYAPIRVLEN